MSYTSLVETENHGTLVVPTNPYAFAKSIQHSQDCTKLWGTHKILFNKGRYFETSIYDEKLRNSISALCGIPVEYGNMFASSWKNMEDFVIAMNIMGYYVNIEVNWI